MTQKLNYPTSLSLNRCYGPKVDQLVIRKTRLSAGIRRNQRKSRDQKRQVSASQQPVSGVVKYRIILVVNISAVSYQI